MIAAGALSVLVVFALARNGGFARSSWEQEETMASLQARVEALEKMNGISSPPRALRSGGGSDGGGDIGDSSSNGISNAMLTPPPPPPIAAANPPTTARDPRLVFIDLGANCGNSFKRLRNQKKLESPDWEAWLWEANPQMVHFYLNDLAKQDRRVRVVELAAWTENKKMQFFLTRGQEDVTDITKFKAHQCKAGSHYQPSGASSLFSGKGDGGEHDVSRRKSKYVAGKAVEVDAVDFNEWMRDQELTDADNVILKIDIEGAEIPLLKHMLASGDEICRVDHFLIEWHSWLLSNKEQQAETAQFENDFINKTVTEKCGKTPLFGMWH